jgi:hypothetical protein
MSGLKKLVPLLDRVLVEKIAPPTKSVGGVLLPESAVQKVAACGAGCPCNVHCSRSRIRCPTTMA